MMRSLLNTRIKAFKLWKVAALALLAIVITCCGTDISDVTQPSTGTVGKPIQVSFQVSYCGNGDDNDQVNLIVAVLLPIGWQGQKNMTMTWSCLTAGSGKGSLEPVPSSVVEAQSGLPWPQALLNQFGIKNNYVNNMQWVVFQSVNQYEVSSITAPVTVNITLTPGADDKNAEVNMEYLVAESKNGLQAPDTYLGAGCSNVPYEYYQLYDGPRFTLTGGNPTTNVDYADPQYGAVVPGAALIDDYITVSFNGAATPTPTALANAPAVYLHARAYATDGTTYTVNEQTSKTIMTETSSSSNTYKLTLWPRAFFGIPSTKTLDHMEYIFSDATGNTQVGFNNTPTPFSYDFLCQ